MTKSMPRVNVEALSGFEREVAEAITNKGRLRATKPTIAYENYRDKYGIERRRPTAPTGLYAYVWRMVAFCASPRRSHQCMPVMAFCDLPDRDTKAASKIEDELRPVIDAVLDQIDPRDWHGVIRWGQAHGKIGTPRYAADGSVIYR